MQRMRKRGGRETRKQEGGGDTAEEGGGRNEKNRVRKKRNGWRGECRTNTDRDIRRK